MGRYKDEGEMLMMSEEILQLNKKEFEKYFVMRILKQSAHQKNHIIRNIL